MSLCPNVPKDILKKSLCFPQTCGLKICESCIYFTTRFGALGYRSRALSSAMKGRVVFTIVSLQSVYLSMEALRFSQSLTTAKSKMLPRDAILRLFASEAGVWFSTLATTATTKDYNYELRTTRYQHWRNRLDLLINARFSKSIPKRTRRR